MAEHKKYKLTKIITRLPCGTILHRIQALRDIREGVKKGDFGGWVQTEDNLAQRGTCWIYAEAKCYHYGKVMKKAILYDHAVVYDNAMLTDEAKVGGTTIMRGNTVIGEDHWEYGSHDYNCHDFSPDYSWAHGDESVHEKQISRSIDDYPCHLEGTPDDL